MEWNDIEVKNAGTKTLVHLGPNARKDLTKLLKGADVPQSFTDVIASGKPCEIDFPSAVTDREGNYART